MNSQNYADFLDKAFFSLVNEEMHEDAIFQQKTAIWLKILYYCIDQLLSIKKKTFGASLHVKLTKTGINIPHAPSSK
jgi:hypothetical protein